MPDQFTQSVIDEFDVIQETFSLPNRDSDAMNAFGQRLKNRFSANEAYRRPKELAWLEDLRQYRGLYDPSTKIEQNNSHVYPKLTRSKMNIVLSRMMKMLYPPKDRNWETEPTPEPSIPQQIVQQIVMSLVQPGEVDPETGQPSQPVMPTPEEVRMAIKQFCLETSKKMQDVMDDQLTEMDYKEECAKKVLRSGLMYGTGILKGPMVFQRNLSKWQPDETGEYQELRSTEDIPYFEFVRLWDWYPDMSVVDQEQMNGSFQRHIMTKHDLRQLMKRKDFYGDVIEQYIKDHPEGDYTPRSWEVDLQAIEVEAGTGNQTGSGYYQTASSSSSFDTQSSYRQQGNRYEPLEYWGFVDGKDLEACGIDIEDVTLEYAVNCWILGNKIIKTMLYEGALDHYKIFYYEKDETSIFGEGLCRIMRHSQIAIAAASRMVLDNGSICSGPNVEINWSLLTPGTDMTSIHPRKIWYREGRGIDAQYPAIRSIEFNSHIPELLSIISTFKQFADEETCLPTWMTGEQVNNETAQATSGRMAMISISIEDIVKNFDAFTEKVMRDLYAWNMEFNPRQDIKGDFKCKALGVSSLVMKEIRMAALANLKNTMQPEDWMYINRREFLEETLKSHDMHQLTLRTEEEAQAYAASQRDERAIELAYAQQEADIAYRKAQAVNSLTKAKTFNVKAIKDAQTPIETPPGTDPRLQDAELAGKEVENVSAAEQIRRDEEQHQLDMQHKHEKHRMDIATGVVKTASELENKNKMVEHSMKMKKNGEKDAKS